MVVVRVRSAQIGWVLHVSPSNAGVNTSPDGQMCIGAVVGDLVVAPVGCYSHSLGSIEQSVYHLLRRTD